MNLNNGQIIVDMDKFIKSHKSIVEAQPKKKVYKPYRMRLEQVLTQLENE